MVFVAVIAIGFGAVLVYGLLTSSGDPTENSDRSLGSVSDITLAGFADPKPVALRSFAGKPLVINYWATWCPFCIDEMPDFQAVYEEVRDDVTFLGVNIQDDESLATELIEITGVRYPMALDPSGDVYQTLGGFSMPTTIFVDEEGEIRERFSGPLTAEELRERIRDHYGV